MTTYSQAQIDALAAAIASGVLTVRHGDVTTTYRSLAEMQTILQTMTENVSGKTVRRSRVAFDNGASRAGTGWRRGWNRGF